MANVHCQGKTNISCPIAFDDEGAVAEAKGSDITLSRFDGDNGEYSFLGNAKGVEGPYTKGTYIWVEVDNMKRLEEKIVTGPYIHHCVGVHKDVVPVLMRLVNTWALKQIYMILLKKR